LVSDATRDERARNQSETPQAHHFKVTERPAKCKARSSPQPAFLLCMASPGTRFTPKSRLWFDAKSGVRTYAHSKLTRRSRAIQRPKRDRRSSVANCPRLYPHTSRCLRVVSTTLVERLAKINLRGRAGACLSLHGRTCRAWRSVRRMPRILNNTAVPQPCRCCAATSLTAASGRHTKRGVLCRASAQRAQRRLVLR
jgi:hypothetical protein